VSSSAPLPAYRSTAAATSGASPGAAPPGARLAGLDGLRALAVAAVVVYHVDPHRLPGGYLGVDVFFGISGFLITHLLVTEHRRAGRIGLRGFWRRRAVRLLPELLLVLAACAVAARLTASGGTGIGDGLRGDTLASLGFVNNWWQIHLGSDYFHHFGSPPLLQHLWSLSVEEQFYLLWPLLLAALLPFARGRRRPRAIAVLTVLAVGGSAGSLWRMHGIGYGAASGSRAYFGTDSHCGALLAGCAAALALPALAGAAERLPRRGRTPVLAALAVLAGFAALGPGDGVMYGWGFAVVAAATAVLCAGCAVGAAPRLLDTAPLRSVGRHSYGIYLWHWPVIVTANALWPDATSTLRAAELLTPLPLAVAGQLLVQRPIAAALRHGKPAPAASPTPSARNRTAGGPDNAPGPHGIGAPDPTADRAPGTPAPTDSLDNGARDLTTDRAPRTPAPTDSLDNGARDRTAGGPDGANEAPIPAGPHGMDAPDLTTDRAPRTPTLTGPHGTDAPDPRGDLAAGRLHRSGVRVPGQGWWRPAPAALAAAVALAATAVLVSPASAPSALRTQLRAGAKYGATLAGKGGDAHFGVPHGSSGSAADPSEPAAPPTPEPGSPAAPSASAPGSSAAAPLLAPGSVDGRDITMIGDSITLGSAQDLDRVLPGIDLYAQVGRMMEQAPDICARLLAQHRLRGTVVLALGTNATFGSDDVDRVRSVVGDRRIVLTTVRGPFPWQDSVNSTVRAYHARHPEVLLDDWYTTVAPHLDLLWIDHVHPRGGAGTSLFATGLADTLTAGGS
jgi:peptidoglycan/LPS O-acetylase OafA/YrhL